ncbi:DUF58 domain-containing protein [Rossellomorea vietnamensis]|uniref:DUF58 domain-containing protein n=1 Tax=Rossellomorea vietnamensis TaxID=218284 RepID=UPI001F19F893|nr:DUF58 domain-containing protein [Rossellomorea vietnamensis]
MTKSSRSLLGRLLFQDKGILPTGRLLVIYLCFSAVLLAGTLVGLSWTWIFILNALFLGLSLIDLTFSPSKKRVEVKRSIPDQMERGLDYTVELTIHNTSDRNMSYRLLDGTPQNFQVTFPLEGELAGHSTVKPSYDVVTPVRGDYQLTRLYFRYRSSLGLWEKQKTVETMDKVKVIPDLTETRKVLEDAQRFLLYEGVKIRKLQSGAGEFSKIRNYVVGDDPRKINWRQTAKLREVMTNEYEPEHGKYITILIDCGRMMGAELKKGNRLEKSLEAALTVTAAALQNGDYVSVLAFSKNVKVYIPPAKGMAHLQTILHRIYNLEVDAAESNYAAVLHYVQTVQKKRSLLLLFSDIHTFLHEDNALYYLQRLRRQHLFLMIGIEDELLVKRIKSEPVDEIQAMMKSMAQKQMLVKKREKSKWEKQGLLMVEAREEKLATTAVSYYIDLMNRGLV